MTRLAARALGALRENPAVAAAVAVALISAGVLTWALVRGDGGGPGPRALATPLPVEGPGAPPGAAPARPARQRPKPRPRPRPVPDPPRIEIPAIGVRAHVISLGLTRGRKLEVPRDVTQAGWWSGGSRPGDAGAAVVVGHVDGSRGPAVFERLGELRPGHLVRYVHADGHTSAFRVQSRESHPKDRFPTRRVYGPTAGPTLRLVTCTGAFDAGRGHYRDNLIVFAAPA